jgi:hypothetical protein
MAIIQKDKLGDCNACPINPSKDPYKSNISIPLANYYQTHEGKNKIEVARKTLIHLSQITTHFY